MFLGMLVELEVNRIVVMFLLLVLVIGCGVCVLVVFRCVRVVLF